MKRLRELAVGVAAMALCALGCMVSGEQAFAAGTGSLHITSSHSGDAAVYDAYRIADDAALPDNAQFNWPGLSGVSLDGYEPYPAYDPASPNSARDGRALVERVSADVSVDNAGVLAHVLEGYVLPGAAPAARVKADGPAVAVPDGWYLLRAHGRRTLFAWVDGGPVELGDKSDTPIIGKQVTTGSGWGTAAVAGSGRTVSYRVDTAVPLAMEASRVYPLTIVDEWDARLLLDQASVRVELLSNTEASRDVTSEVSLKTGDRELTVAVDDLHRLGAVPGDTVRVSYTMSLAPGARIDAQGLANAAHAVFDTWAGEASTPDAVTRVYAMQLEVKKVDVQGAPLAGAVCAVRADGGWLASDGSFGSASRRAEFVSREDGTLEGLPLLADGSYELVELTAPHGYKVAGGGSAGFELKLRTDDGKLSVDARATQPLRVARVDAASSTVCLELVNEKAASWLPGFIPQTGDTAWAIAAVVLTAAGAALVLMGARRSAKRS